MTFNNSCTHIDWGLGLALGNIKKASKMNMPYFLQRGFDFFETELYHQEVLLVHVQHDTYTPKQLHHITNMMKDKVSKPIIFVFDQLVAYKRQRLMDKQINFIIPDKIAFIPTLLIHIQAYRDVKPIQKKITPLAQVIVLYHLQVQKLIGCTTKELAEIFSSSYITTRRAVNCLINIGCCPHSKDKEYKLQFIYEGKELWAYMLDYLVSPVDKVVYTDEVLMHKKAFISEELALAHYSMLAETGQTHWAIGKKAFKSVTLDYNNDDGEHAIEVWKYNPELLAKDGYIDKLSLYLLLKNHTDERVQIELDTLIKNIVW